MQTWVLASSNAGKLAELQALFARADVNVQLVTQGSLGIVDAPEDGLSFVENALKKARHASSHSQKPAIADDSGLCVPVLGNMPGIYSARFAGKHGDDAANNQKLLDMLAPYFAKQIPVAAFFVCVLVFVRHQDDPMPIIAQGLWHGQITSTPQGAHGFGYDPIFWLPHAQKTAAMLSAEQKNSQSHRHKALQNLMQALRECGFCHQ